jgi:hypothetical protein
VRIPKAIIEQAGPTEEVDLEVRGNTVVIVAPGELGRAGPMQRARWPPLVAAGSWIPKLARSSTTMNGVGSDEASATR